MNFHVTLVWMVGLLVDLAACGSTATSTAEVQADPTPTEAPAPTEMPEPTEAPASLSLARTIERPFIPHDIAVDDEGNLYTVELHAPMVHRLDGDGNVLASWGGAGSEPGQFAFDPPPEAPPASF